MLSIMLNQQGQPQHFAEFGKRNQVEKKKADCSKTFHNKIKGNYSLDNSANYLMPVHVYVEFNRNLEQAEVSSFPKLGEIISWHLLTNEIFLF